MQDHFRESGIAAGIRYSQDEQMFSRGNGRNMQAKLFRARVEYAIGWRYRQPWARIQRPFRATQRGRCILRIEDDVGGGSHTG